MFLYRMNLFRKKIHLNFDNIRMYAVVALKTKPAMQISGLPTWSLGPFQIFHTSSTDARAALNAACGDIVQELGVAGGRPFLGGVGPDRSDLAAFG